MHGIMRRKTQRFAFTMTTKKPLWSCPRCGHRFVTQNLWHSCGQYKLSDHFVGKDPVVRELFDALTKQIRRNGPVTIYAQKTRIVFQVRVRFVSVMCRKQWLDCTIWLKRRVEHPLLRRLEFLPPYNYIHHFRLTEKAQIEEIEPLVRQSYAIGCQDEPVPPQLM